MPDEVERFFGGYPDPVRELALATRALVRSSLPGADETLDRSGRLVGYGFGPGYRNTICVIIPSQKGVKLGFAGGATLPDPKALLEGEGKAHRHVPLKALSDLQQPGMKGLFTSAIKAWKAKD